MKKKKKKQQQKKENRKALEARCGPGVYGGYRCATYSPHHSFTCAVKE